MSTTTIDYTPPAAKRNAKQRVSRPCSHCHGSGAEPPPLELRFSRSGDRRGELRQLAELSGVPGPVISRTFAGQSVPSLATVVLLAEALGVSESRLIRSQAIWSRLMAELSE